ncbi:NAD(+) hydrolase sarm1 isoform X2 [Onthophagus taurus]|uniref:NAD(+) hydrolase sarm1 isoform X2 n=1 Tax=Onthophagus taurus TaxID=166361 RepID=UPI000C20EBE4|nr:sterile alpha and TIR motif-containing protein 1 isoform X2 [Onthophagus taurus]
MGVNKINIPEPNVRRFLLNRKMASDLHPSDTLNGNDVIMAKTTTFPHTTPYTSPRVISTTSQLQTNTQSSTTTSRVAKTSSVTTSSQRFHVTKSSSTSDSKVTSVQSDLKSLKNNFKEMKTIAETKTRFNSVETLVDGDDMNSDTPQPLVTFPDDTPVPSELNSPTNLLDTVKFEQKTVNNYKTSKVVKDGFSAEKKSANCAELKRVQAGDVSYEENSAAASSHARLEVDGISAEKSQVQAMEARSLIAGDISQQESKNMAHTTMKVTTDTFSQEKTQSEANQRKQMVTASGVYNEQHSSSSQSTSFTATTKGIHTSASSKLLSSAAQFQLNDSSKIEDELINMSADDLEQLSQNSNNEDIVKAIQKYAAYFDKSFQCLRQKDMQGEKSCNLLEKVNDIMRKAWAVPTHGHELGYELCNAMRKCGLLDLLIANCINDDDKLKISSAKLLEQCLTTENREHVVAHGLDKVVHVACVCTKNSNTVNDSRIGTGILEHLFKHSEETCSDVIRLGGLDALLFECRKKDVETLRHCAGALANLSLYGGAENQEAMIKRKVPMWLFPLAFHTDDNIKYYACLAITVLVANAEIEAEVIQSGTLGLVEPFVTSHNPSEFARSNLAHAHGQSKTWLQHLVPVLSSKREEARNLAAFHFCMEAGIKKQQCNTNIFAEIGAIESLKRVASSPNAVASKYAAQALRLIGEEVPHKLSQQVPLWSVEDVEEWVKQIGFSEVATNFVESRVDGDLLLQLTEENLIDDIGLANGIKRKRFTRELIKLKKLADYTSRDIANINHFLQNLGPDYGMYTYSMLNAGVGSKDSLCSLSEDQLLQECGITNSIHRARIMEGIKAAEKNSLSVSEDNMNKPLDVFVSYRRSNGSQLASLLKVHLQLRGFSVFIDVERLEAGKFDNNLLQSIQKAKHFLLVLTPNALERCVGDVEKKDWVHREIVAALQAQCNIIPIIDNFAWPETDVLPEDMRQVCHFNGVRWIHDYQDACVDKLERFMRGEVNAKNDTSLSRVGMAKGDLTPGTPSNPGLSRPPVYQRMHSNDSGKGDKDVNGNRD